MSKLYFVRHGQSLWNVENKICGATDIGLTEEGFSQAKQTGELIQRQGIIAAEILASPLMRAKDTAAEISKVTGIPYHVDERLIEQNFGIWEGTPRHGKDFETAKRIFCNNFESGESMLRVAQRIYNLLDEIKERQSPTILVAHNGIARVVHSYFNDLSNEEFASYGIDNCTVVEYDI